MVQSLICSHSHLQQNTMWTTLQLECDVMVHFFALLAYLVFVFPYFINHFHCLHVCFYL